MCVSESAQRLPAMGEALSPTRMALIGLILSVSLCPDVWAAQEMRSIPAGQARIGSDRGPADEGPPFRMAIPAFELDRTPVTVAAFAAYVQKTGFVSEAERLGSGAVMRFGTGQWSLVAGASWRLPQGPEGEKAVANHPVTQVSWNDASAYCKAMGKRLPSEFEHEYAARGASDKNQTHAFGEQLEQNGRYRANVWTGVFPMLNTKKDGYAGTSPVGVFGEDALGLSDMAGNVWEWTEDWYRPYAERHQPGSEVQGGEKVQRGGSFLCDPKLCYGFRATARAHATPDTASLHVGFRCARSLATRNAMTLLRAPS